MTSPFHPVSTDCFLVFVDGTSIYGRRVCGLCDVDGENLDRRGAISNVLDSCISPSHVLCLTPDGHWSDVSEDIARDVIEHCRQNAMSLPSKAEDFCSKHLGETRVAYASRHLGMLEEAMG